MHGGMFDGGASWSSYCMENGGSSVGGDDEMSLHPESELNDNVSEGGLEGGLGNIHAPAQAHGQAGYPHFANDNGPWISTASVFGESGECPRQVVCIEIEAKSFESKGGRITLDSILNVDSDDTVTTGDQRRQAEAVLVNLLLGPTVGGSMSNGTVEEEKNPEEKSKHFTYDFKDPNAPTRWHPCFTVHIEEVPDTQTQEPFKYRLWYMVWDPGFTIARSVGMLMHANNQLHMDTHAQGLGAGKKRALARNEKALARGHVKTQWQSIRSGGELHYEYRKYFGDRNAKINTMARDVRSAPLLGSGQAHPCALENVLNPRDPDHGATVLKSTANDEFVHIHPEQSNPRAYFDENGRFYPPEYVRKNNLFHTLHPDFAGDRDIRQQPLPTRGVLSAEETLLVNHFAKFFLKPHPDLSMHAKHRSFEAFLAGKDYDPRNTTRSREEIEAWNISKWCFSSNMFAQTTETKDGKCSQINPLKELREKHDRMDRLIACAAEDEMDELHAAARSIVLKNLQSTMEQRAAQLPKGTRHFWEEGNRLMTRRKTPMSMTKGKVSMKNKSMFHVFVERLYTFSRQKLGAQDPMAIMAFMVNSYASSTLEPAFVLSVYGPAGGGKSELMHRYGWMSLNGMNQQSQVQSAKARLRSDPYDAYHEIYDEAPAVLEVLKVPNKTPEQLDAINSYKRKITEQTTSHAVPQEVTQADGTKILQDVQILTDHRSSSTVLHNGNCVYGVTQHDDNVKSVLRRQLNLGMLHKHDDQRRVAEPSLSDPNFAEECDDFKKNEFLVRTLLTLAYTSGEFEVDFTCANEIFRRLDQADGRPFAEPGFMGHRRTILEVVTAWYAVQCVFDATNYHDFMPQLKDSSGGYKPWTMEMMALCVPFLKAPTEEICYFVWHFHDVMCQGRGPVVDQTMVLLAKEAGFKSGEYREVASHDLPPKGSDGYATALKEKRNALDERFIENILKRDETWQHLRTLYPDALIVDTLNDVCCVEKCKANSTRTCQVEGCNEEMSMETSIKDLKKQTKTEEAVVGLGNYSQEYRPMHPCAMIDWRYAQTGYRTVPELANALSYHANKNLNLSAEVISGALYWLKSFQNDYIGTETSGTLIEGQTKFCYHPDNDTSTEGCRAEEFSIEWLIHKAMYDHNQFPAMRATSTKRAATHEPILVSKRGASNSKSIKASRNDASSGAQAGGSEMQEYGLCVQTHSVIAHARREHYGMLYASTHPQIKSEENFLHRHGLARAKLQADLVIDLKEDFQYVTPYHHPSTHSPLHVTTTTDVNLSVWTTPVKRNGFQPLSADALQTINGVRPQHEQISGRSNPQYDTLSTSNLWRFYQTKIFKTCGISEQWGQVVADARTNQREHDRNLVFEVTTTGPSNVASSSSSTAPLVVPPIVPLAI